MQNNDEVQDSRHRNILKKPFPFVNDNIYDFKKVSDYVESLNSAKLYFKEKKLEQEEKMISQKMINFIEQVVALYIKNKRSNFSVLIKFEDLVANEGLGEPLKKWFVSQILKQLKELSKPNTLQDDNKKYQEYLDKLNEFKIRFEKFKGSELASKGLKEIKNREEKCVKERIKYYTSEPSGYFTPGWKEYPPSRQLLEINEKSKLLVEFGNILNNLFPNSFKDPIDNGFKKIESIKERVMENINLSQKKAEQEWERLCAQPENVAKLFRDVSKKRSFRINTFVRSIFRSNDLKFFREIVQEIVKNPELSFEQKREHLLGAILAIRNQMDKEKSKKSSVGRGGFQLFLDEIISNSDYGFFDLYNGLSSNSGKKEEIINNFKLYLKDLTNLKSNFMIKKFDLISKLLPEPVLQEKEESMLNDFKGKIFNIKTSTENTAASQKLKNHIDYLDNFLSEIEKDVSLTPKKRLYLFFGARAKIWKELSDFEKGDKDVFRKFLISVYWEMETYSNNDKSLLKSCEYAYDKYVVHNQDVRIPVSDQPKAQDKNDSVEEVHSKKDTENTNKVQKDLKHVKSSDPLAILWEYFDNTYFNSEKGELKKDLSYGYLRKLFIEVQRDSSRSSSDRLLILHGAVRFELCKKDNIIDKAPVSFMLLNIYNSVNSSLGINAVNSVEVFNQYINNKDDLYEDKKTLVDPLVEGLKNFNPDHREEYNNAFSKACELLPYLSGKKDSKERQSLEKAIDLVKSNLESYNGIHNAAKKKIEGWISELKNPTVLEVTIKNAERNFIDIDEDKSLGKYDKEVLKQSLGDAITVAKNQIKHPTILPEFKNFEDREEDKQSKNKRTKNKPDSLRPNKK